MKASLFLAIAALVPVTHAADWRGFYEESVLRHWQKEMPPGIRENFEEVIWPKLTPKEKAAAGAVELKFPLELQDSLLNFYALWGGGKSSITLPISSLRFYGDIALAYVMISMAVYGAMVGNTTGGASVALERSVGWSRGTGGVVSAPGALSVSSGMGRGCFVGKSPV